MPTFKIRLLIPTDQVTADCPIEIDGQQLGPKGANVDVADAARIFPRETGQRVGFQLRFSAPPHGHEEQRGRLRPPPESAASAESTAKAVGLPQQALSPMCSKPNQL